MNRAYVPNMETSAAVEPRRAPMGVGDVYPIPPSGYDRLRHARVLAEFERGDDPWLDEWLDGGWEGPTVEDEEALGEDEAPAEPMVEDEEEYEPPLVTAED